MHVLDTNEVFGTTFYTYDRIMELGGKNGPDAFALYVKLIKQSRIQQTDQTRTLNNFLKKGLGWGDERLKKARGVLKQLGLIDDVIIRGDEGKIEGHYVRVNFLINEQNIRSSCITYDLSTEALNHDVDKSTCGETGNKCLKNQTNKCLKNQTKNISAGEISTTSEKKKRTTNEHLLEGEKKEQFEKFYKQYPHYQSRSSRKNSIQKFLKLDVEEVMKGVAILKRQVESGQLGRQFVKASERWLENFTPMSEHERKACINEIFIRHMNKGGDDKKERIERIKEDFPDIDFKPMLYEYQKGKSLLNKLKFT